MQFLRNASIQRKLSFLTVFVTTSALVLAATAFVAYDLRAIRQTKVKQLQSLATALAHNSTAALEFFDDVNASQILSSFHSQPTVELAGIYDVDAAAFAQWPEDPAGTNPLPPLTDQSVVFTEEGFLEIAVPIQRDEESLGTLFVRSNLDDVNAAVENFLFIAGGTLVCSLVLALVLSRWLQRVFTAPVMHLVDVVQRISDEHDYSLRTDYQSRDEFGRLCDGFNEMVGEIQTGRAKLESINDELEDRVEQRTAELAEALEDARAASRAKSEFLAKMSHEIRTPMTAILGHADLLMDDDQKPTDRADSVNTIRRNGKHLMSVINDILDISKIEAGRMTVEIISASPHQLVADTASLMRPKAAEKKLDFDIRFEGAIPETIQTDPTRLRQILLNLTGNAIKFTESGSVSITTCFLQADENNADRLEFAIKDTGIGLTQKQQSKLFQAFAQGDDSMNRRFGGTGLGLAISRSFARLLNGDITLESCEGEGSTFAATATTGSLEGVRMVDGLREAGQSKSASRKAPKIKLDCRVLLVEDGPDNQKLVSFMLRKAGAEVDIADNGLIGMQTALAARENGTPYDVILTDMQMPVMDGYTATAKLREQNYAGPIVALTAHAMTDDAQKCIDAGCDAYTTKPVNRAELMQIVSDYAAAGPDAKWLSETAPSGVVD